jgi:ADP-ribosyl-[dinitrogen reductase] hydrolase
MASQLEPRRILGSLLGLAVGDALGAPLEGSSPPRAAQAIEDGLEMSGGGAWTAGEWTDDTAMALCLAESIAENGLLDTTDLAVRYIAWARKGKGIGRTTRAALRGAASAADARARAEKFYRETGAAAGNGTVMRATPIGLSATSVEDAVWAAHEDAKLTHFDAAAAAASAALSAALMAIRGRSSPVDAAAAQVADHPKLEQVLEAVWTRDADFIADLAAGPEMGTCWTTLGVALHALLTAGDYESGVRWAIGLGGDTDTNAAVAGALLGCRHGPDSIPERWLAPLRQRERIERAAAALAQRTSEVPP